MVGRGITAMMGFPYIALTVLQGRARPSLCTNLPKLRSSPWGQVPWPPRRVAAEAWGCEAICSGHLVRKHDERVLVLLAAAGLPPKRRVPLVSEPQGRRAAGAAAVDTEWMVRVQHAPSSSSSWVALHLDQT